MIFLAIVNEFFFAFPHFAADFDDFANAGQVYFDQFIASAQKKWGRSSGLITIYKKTKKKDTVTTNERE